MDEDLLGTYSPKIKRKKLEFEEGPGGTVIKNLKEHFLNSFQVLEERVKALDAGNTAQQRKVERQMEKILNINYSPDDFCEVQEYVEKMQKFPAPMNNALAFATTIYAENKSLEAENAELRQQLERARDRIKQLDFDRATEICARVNAERRLSQEPCTVEKHKELESDNAELTEQLKRIREMCQQYAE